jgi:hypothetical protein
MFNFLAKTSSGTAKSVEFSPGVSFVKLPQDILKELTLSKESGSLIGVYSSLLGEGMFLTKVESLHFESMHDDLIVVLNRYDMSGHILTTTSIALSEIRIVCPFRQLYENPVLSLKRSTSLFKTLAP